MPACIHVCFFVCVVCLGRAVSILSPRALNTCNNNNNVELFGVASKRSLIHDVFRSSDPSAMVSHGRSHACVLGAFDAKTHVPISII